MGLAIRVAAVRGFKAGKYRNIYEAIESEKRMRKRGWK